MKKQNNRTIKAHFIRSALYVLLLLAVCVIPFALAQRNANNRSVAPATSRNFNPATAPPSTEADQSTDDGRQRNYRRSVYAFRLFPKHRRWFCMISTTTLQSSVLCPRRSPIFRLFNSDLADDFVVPAGQTWNVQSIDADGVYFAFDGPANSFNVFFYADNAGLPGAQVYSAMNQPFSVAGSTFTVALPSEAVLTEGTYWVEIQANMTFLPNGAWLWRDRTVQSNQGAAWQNPGGGFGVCPTWTLKTTCIPITGGPIRCSGLTARREEALRLHSRLRRQQPQQLRQVVPRRLRQRQVAR